MLKAMIITGMHRSGTSALSGALTQMGVHFGKRLTSPSGHNPKGYFENPEIVALHSTARHPWEVAKSLARRNGLKSSKAFLLWLDHTLQAESAIRGYKRRGVAFDELLDNP